MLETLFTRRTKPGEPTREHRPPGPRPLEVRRPESVRSEPPEAAALVRALLASRNLLVALKDLDGRYLEVNDAYARALGLEVQAVRGRLDRDLLAPEFAGELAQRERLAMRGVVLKPEIESFDGGPATSFLVERLPVRDARGAVRAVCLVAMEAPALSEPAAVAADLAQLATATSTPAAERAAATAGETRQAWLCATERSTALEWDPTLYRSLLSHFCRRYAGFASRAAEHAAGADIEGFVRELCQLARGARNLGALPLADLAASLVGALQERGALGLGPNLAAFDRALDATVLVMECRIRETSDPFEWTVPGRDGDHESCAALALASA
jgi:hypothetical protein